MDVSASATIASSQGGIQQQLGLSAMRMNADTQKQLANLLDQSAQTEMLRTSGSVGTQVNTTA